MRFSRYAGMVAFVMLLLAGVATWAYWQSQPLNLAPGAKPEDRVMVDCVFERTGKTQRVILRLDMSVTAAAKLLQENVYLDPHAKKEYQWAALFEPTLLMDGKPVAGADLREAGVRDGSKIKLSFGSGSLTGNGPTSVVADRETVRPSAPSPSTTPAPGKP